MHSLTLVVILLTSAQSELHFASAVLIEIDRQRYQGQALLRFDGAVELVYLLLMHQKSARSQRVDIVPVALLVRRYMHACHDEFALARYLGITLLDAHTALADGLDLSPCEHDARLITLLDEIVVKGLLVIRYYLSSFSLTHFL